MKQSDFSKEYDDKNLHLKQISVIPDKKIVKNRKSLAEHPFGIVKRAMGAPYCLMRGKKYVTGEFSLLFLAFNMKRAINILGAEALLQAIPT